MSDKPKETDHSATPDDQQKKASEEVSEEIDDLELEPIAANLPSKSPESKIPNKHDLPDKKDPGEPASEKAEDDDSEEASDPEESEPKSRRWFPSEKSVDLSEKNPADNGDSDQGKDLDLDLEEIDDEPDSDDDVPIKPSAEPVTRQPKEPMTGVEKLAIAILLILVLGGLAVYLPQMIPEGTVTETVVDEAETPIKRDRVTIESLEARWIDTIDIMSKVRRGVEWTPKVDLQISGEGEGALRVIFFDQDGKERGDTIDFAFRNGVFVPSNESTGRFYCTQGLGHERELKDIQARGDVFWTARILLGPKVKAPLSEFEQIVEIRVPYDLMADSRD